MRILAPQERAIRGRVALIVPRWTNKAQQVPQGVPFRSFSIGAAFLAAGYELVFFDQEHDWDRADRLAGLLAALRGSRAAFIWMNESYPSNQFANTLRLATAIRRGSPGVPVVAGGEMITICPAEFFQVESPVDYFLRGYGEASGIRLLEHLAAGTEPADVPGLIRRLPDGSFRALAPEPKPAFEVQYLELYRRLDLSCYVQEDGGVFGNGIPTLSVSMGRGCTKGCPFCCWSNHPSKVLGGREAYQLLADLRDRYGVTQFHIGELDFFMSRKRALQMADLLARHRPDVRWFALGSPIDMIGLGPGEWDRLRDGGLRKVELGSESGSARMLRAIGKRHTPEDVYEISVAMLQRGIAPMNNFLFGFPGETHADREATLRLIDRLIAVGSTRNHFTYRHYQPVWGTPLGDAAWAAVPERPRRIDTWLAEHVRFGDDRTRSMPWLPAADERELKRLIDYDLPLATSQLVVASPWRRAVYRALRARARQNLRRGGRERRVDRWIYDRVLGGRLNRTFVP